MHYQFLHYIHKMVSVCLE